MYFTCVTFHDIQFFVDVPVYIVFIIFGESHG